MERMNNTHKMRSTSIHRMITFLAFFSYIEVCYDCFIFFFLLVIICLVVSLVFWMRPSPSSFWTIIIYIGCLVEWAIVNRWFNHLIGALHAVPLRERQRGEFVWTNKNSNIITICFYENLFCIPCDLCERIDRSVLLVVGDFEQCCKLP